MVDGVECCGEVEEDEDVQVAGVRGEEVVCDFEKSCFGAVF